MDGSMRRKIESVYGSLRPSERKAADYLLEYRGRAGDLLMEELAGAAGVSQPTVMRFVKALGYSGKKGRSSSMGFSFPAGTGWRKFPEKSSPLPSGCWRRR